MTAATGTSSAGRGVGLWAGLGLATLAVVALLVLSSRTPTGDPFDPRSSAPDGYRAIAILLREHGATVTRANAATASSRDWGPGDVLVVPVPSYATPGQRAAFTAAADAGATIVLGEPVDDSESDSSAFESFGAMWLDGRTLADTPADPMAPGRCDISVLAGLGDVDAAFVPPIDVGSQGFEPTAGATCYGDGEAALIRTRPVGAGQVITLGSAYLWANARLQPAKEDGGEPLDNAATALRLLDPTSGAAPPRVTMVDARPSAGVTTGGGQDPVQLLPVPVKLALVQLVAAFAIFVWWRSRRLGRPMTEQVPVAAVRPR